MNKNNIIKGKTLVEYKKKYRYSKLRKIYKYEADNTPELIAKGTWWFIDGVYYEIPKPIRFKWFRNLNIGIQIATCALGVGVVATAITVPVVVMNSNSNKDPKLDIVSTEDHTKIEFDTADDESYIYRMKVKDASKEKIKEIAEVTVGNYVLICGEEYTWHQVEESPYTYIVIKRIVYKTHKGQTVITPVLESITK